MNNTTSRALDLIDGYTRNLRTLAPAARAHIQAQLTMLDGYPTTTDTSRTSTTAELTTVEAFANQRLQLTNTTTDWDNRLDTTVHVLRALLNEMRHTITTHITTTVPRCTATGREGAINWHRPDCWDAPVRGPLCFTCYQRERRWREGVGLPTRGDVA